MTSTISSRLRMPTCASARRRSRAAWKFCNPTWSVTWPGPDGRRERREPTGCRRGGSPHEAGDHRQPGQSARAGPEPRGHERVEEGVAGKKFRDQRDQDRRGPAGRSADFGIAGRAKVSSRASWKAPCWMDRSTLRCIVSRTCRRRAPRGLMAGGDPEARRCQGRTDYARGRPGRGHCLTERSSRRAARVRAAQLTVLRSDLTTADIRGNIDTRLKKFRENPAWSALILAAAVLERLKPDLSGLNATYLSYEDMLPAPGQGALGLQTRRENADDIRKLVGAVHDRNTAAEVEAERMFLHALGGGCREPIAAYAQVLPDNLLKMDGIAWLIGEKTPRRGQLVRRMDQPEILGVDLAVEISR